MRKHKEKVMEKDIFNEDSSMFETKSFEKTKKIEKKPKGDQKNYTGHEVKKGRPIQIDRIEVKQDPTLNVQQVFLKYLEKIGLKHGLVFRESDRVKLQKENGKKMKNQIEWSKDHEWDKHGQTKKLINNIPLRKILLQYEEANKEWEFNDLVQIFLNIGDIAAQQCTGQIYNTMGLVLELILEKKSNQEEDEKILQLYYKLIFLTGNFTKIYVQYWIEIIPDEDQIRTLFLEMVKSLKEEFIKVLQHPKEAKQFIMEQRQMDEILRIISSSINKCG